ncbi:MAG: pro-sigmaK processing inhibitor BofA family protein [Clostridia bacterium]|nr:pro-sigmaK processing inhibitor BofA family protein [Clostridia bacterium]
MNQNPMEFFVAFVLGLILLFILIRLLYVPLRMALKLFINSIAGGALLLFLNLLLRLFGMSVGINAVTSAIAGVLGVPGIALLLFLQIILRA